jgi:hypothetical protein
MWVIPSLILLLGVANMVAGASHPPAPVLLAFAPDENPTAARPAGKKPIVKAMNKAALKHKTPAGRPTPSPVDKPPLLRPSPETAPM